MNLKPVLFPLLMLSGAATATGANFNVWVPQLKLVGSQSPQGGQLGTSVALHGDTAVVGAPLADIGANSDQGEAYIFVRDGDGWVEQARLVADDGVQSHRFGHAVAVHGDTVVIGAHGANSGHDSSAVYVFTRSGDSWNEQAKLTASDGHWSDHFGWSVALDGDVLLVGAKQSPVDGMAFRGAAYVYERNGMVWTEQAKLVPGDLGRQFGWSVALDGLTALIGAPYTDDFQGAAYTFVRAGNNWTEQVKLVAEDGEEDDQFGISVALEGTTAIVGAPEKRIAGRQNQGAAYVFERTGATWPSHGRITAVGGEIGDRFGYSLALDGSRLLAGESKGGFRAGAARLFSRAGAIWTERELFSAPDGQGTQNDFGLSVALDGGVILAGAARALVDGTGRGAAYLFADIDAGRLEISPDPVDFGDVVAGYTSESLSATITNVGTEAVTVTGIGTPEAPFENAGGSCGEPPFPMAPGGACTFDYRFAAAGVGEFDTQLEITSDTPFSPDAFVLIGRGVPPQPGIEVSPGSVVLQLYSGAAGTRELEISNTGLADLEWEIIVEDTLNLAGTVRRPVRSATMREASAERGVISGLATSGAGYGRVTPPLGAPAGDSVTLTHSETMDIVPGTPACAIPGTPYSYPTRYLRTFTLPDFGIPGEFAVSEVTFAVESLVMDDPEIDTVDITVNLYTLDGEDFIYTNMTLLASETVGLEDQTGTLHTLPIDALVPAGGTLVMEVAAPLLDYIGRFHGGSNPDGESAPSYIAAPHCGAGDPVTMASVNAPDVHLVMSVSGLPMDCLLPEWMGAAPTEGTVAPDQSALVELNFDAAGLAPGFFQGELCIDSNDPGPRTRVPVAVTVVDDLQDAKMIASDGGTFHGFGAAVALDGEIALAGAPGNNVDGQIQAGAAYIFAREDGAWSERTGLTAPQPGQLARFGEAVALSDGMAVIGAGGTTVGDNMFQGAVHVFVRDGDEWEAHATLTLIDGEWGDLFGSSLALDGDTLLVGAPGVNVDGNNAQGAAYVFTRDGDDWNLQTRLVAAAGGVNDQFGRSVALYDGTALIGAGNAEIDGQIAHGAAYVFTRDGGDWQERARLLAADGEAFDRFGSAVALAGDTAVVGGNGATIDGDISRGAAWVFTGGGAAWTEQAKLYAPDGAGSDNFGGAVAVSGNVALVGVEFANVNDNGNQGAAYVFTRAVTDWSVQAKLVANDGAASDRFGTAVALGGDTALIGAPSANIGGNNGQGAAYVFTLDVDTGAPALVFEPASLDFGDVEIGQSEALTVVLVNAGDGGATDLVFEWSGHDDYAVDSGACGTALAAGESCQIEIAFAPAEPGPAEALLVVSGDHDAAAQLPVSGNGVAPATAIIDVDPLELTFDLDSGQSGSRALTIANLGDAGLVWTIAQARYVETFGDPEGVPWLSIDPRGGEIAPGDSVTVDVAVDATDLGQGEYTALIYIASNDPEIPMIEVPVMLTVGGPGPEDEIFKDRFE